MAQIRYTIAKTITDYLELKLITEIDDSDPIKAKVVKFGRFQQDPTINNIFVTVSGGNLQKPGTLDGIVTIEEMNNIAMKVPAREIGGGQTWWRRGWLEIGCYFVLEDYTAEEAGDHAHNFLGRVSLNLRQAPVCGLADDYGETAYDLFVYAESMFPGGGPTNQYLWRGQMLWQTLTYREGV